MVSVSIQYTLSITTLHRETNETQIELLGRFRRNIAFPSGAAVFPVLLIIVVFSSQLVFTVKLGNRVAAVGVLLVLCGGIMVMFGSPYLRGETTLGLFHSSPMVVEHNNSEYWNNNVKTCLCKDEDCEDLVYREYLIRLYALDGVGLRYTRFSEFKRLKNKAQHLNGTSVKNGDSPSPSFDRRYHEVCYSKSSGDMGNKTLCYSCYGCEEKILRDEQTTLWEVGNLLSVLGFLLIVSNMILFLAESWARYRG